VLLDDIARLPGEDQADEEGPARSCGSALF
jgi:hypothetical protein